jgi:hypothetical protein
MARIAPVEGPPAVVKEEGPVSKRVSVLEKEMAFLRERIALLEAGNAITRDTTHAGGDVTGDTTGDVTQLEQFRARHAARQKAYRERKAASRG